MRRKTKRPRSLLLFIGNNRVEGSKKNVFLFCVFVFFLLFLCFCVFVLLFCVCGFVFVLFFVFGLVFVLFVFLCFFFLAWQAPSPIADRVRHLLTEVIVVADGDTASRALDCELEILAFTGGVFLRERRPCRLPMAL